MPEVVKQEPKVAANLVTSENREAFMEARLRPQPAAKEEPKAEEPKADAKVEAAPKGAKAEEKPAEPDKKGKQHGINERFSELTQARKGAEAKADAEAKRAAKAEQEAAELRAKLAPPKEEPKAEPDAKPTREQFTTEADFHEALTVWRVDQRLAERDREAAETRAMPGGMRSTTRKRSPRRRRPSA